MTSSAAWWVRAAATNASWFGTSGAYSFPTRTSSLGSSGAMAGRRGVGVGPGGFGMRSLEQWLGAADRPGPEAAPGGTTCLGVRIGIPIRTPAGHPRMIVPRCRRGLPAGTEKGVAATDLRDERAVAGRFRVRSLAVTNSTVASPAGLVPMAGATNPVVTGPADERQAGTLPPSGGWRRWAHAPRGAISPGYTAPRRGVSECVRRSAS